MKHLAYLFTIISIGTVSCVAQPTAPAAAPTPPARPARANAATLAAPPAPARPLEDADEADIRHEAEKIRGDAEKLKIAGDQLAKAKFDFTLADPFNERDDANQTLVLSHDLADGRAQADTEEDLKVMAHILQKASRSADERSAGNWGIIYRSPFGSSPAVRNLYLEGYGAIFFLNVNYSITPPAAKPEETEPKNDRNTEWENARREVSDPHHVESSFKPVPISTESAPYDPEKVEALQKNLAQALKNASHIRALRADESVTIVVSARNPSGTKIPTRTLRRAGPDAQSEAMPHRPRLMIRAKKSDIEALENQRLSLEEFRKKLTVSLG